jgi:protein gp37
MGRTSIEWTQSEDGTKGYTWNPVTGCSKVSAGCTNCYAERLSHRFKWTDKPWNAAYAAENVKLHPERLEEPLKWKRPRRVFVNSMSDLFHEQVPFEFIAKVFDIMAHTPEHTYQILTKRPARMKEFIERYDPENLAPYPLPNVWLGVSVENQDAADERIPLLLQTPAAVRFLSCEPLLGPVDLTRINLGVKNTRGYGPRRIEWDALTGWEHHYDPDSVKDDHSKACVSNPSQKVNWVIVGGESGPNARPMHPAWVRSLRDQCKAAGVAFFFKQWGEWAPWADESKYTHGEAETARNAQTYVNLDGTTGLVWIVDDDGVCQNWTGTLSPMSCVVSRVGKTRAGRELDGRTWDEYPVVQ